MFRTPLIVAVSAAAFCSALTLAWAQAKKDDWPARRADHFMAEVVDAAKDGKVFKAEYKEIKDDRYTGKWIPGVFKVTPKTKILFELEPGAATAKIVMKKDQISIWLAPGSKEEVTHAKVMRGAAGESKKEEEKKK